MLKNIIRLTPEPFLDLVKKIYYPLIGKKYLLFGRPSGKGETSKARKRREQEGFFEKYCVGKGLDIGFGGDLVCGNAVGFDFEHGDAQILDGIDNESFDFVYSSHTLEHLNDPKAGIQRWWNVLKKGGYLIIYVPHRDLYEQKKELPSRMNPNHRYYFMPDDHDPPDTLGIRRMIEEELNDHQIIYVKECSDGYSTSVEDSFPSGEFSIEAVVRKES